METENPLANDDHPNDRIEIVEAVDGTQESPDSTENIMQAVDLTIAAKIGGDASKGELNDSGIRIDETIECEENMEVKHDVVEQEGPVEQYKQECTEDIPEEEAQVEDVVYERNEGGLHVNPHVDNVDQPEEEIDDPPGVDSLPAAGMHERVIDLTMNGDSEVMRAARALFSKRTRTLYHWMYPDAPKMQLKNVVANAWEEMLPAEKQFYVSQVLGKFGCLQSQLMVNPQLDIIQTSQAAAPGRIRVRTLTSPSAIDYTTPQHVDRENLSPRHINIPVQPQQQQQQQHQQHHQQQQQQIDPQTSQSHPHPLAHSAEAYEIHEGHGAHVTRGYHLPIPEPAEHVIHRYYLPPVQYADHNYAQMPPAAYPRARAYVHTTPRYMGGYYPTASWLPPIGSIRRRRGRPRGSSHSAALQQRLAMDMQAIYAQRMHAMKRIADAHMPIHIRQPLHPLPSVVAEVPNLNEAPAHYVEVATMGENEFHNDPELRSEFEKFQWTLHMVD